MGHAILPLTTSVNVSALVSFLHPMQLARRHAAFFHTTASTLVVQSVGMRWSCDETVLLVCLHINLYSYVLSLIKLLLVITPIKLFGSIRDKVSFKTGAVRLGIFRWLKILHLTLGPTLEKTICQTVNLTDSITNPGLRLQNPNPFLCFQLFMSQLVFCVTTITFYQDALVGFPKHPLSCFVTARHSRSST